MQDRDERRRTQLVEVKGAISLPLRMDVSAKLASQNLLWGMARTLQALRKIDSRAEIRFIASPDFTITRSQARWGSGFAYGGLTHFKCSEPVVLVELRPNTCGTLFARIEKEANYAKLRNRIVTYRSTQQQLEWDYGRKNHFINLYQENEETAYVLVHGCPKELKADTDERPGLYFDRSPYWQARITTIETDFGECFLLVGGAATEFLDMYQQAEMSSLMGREKVATDIFDEITILSNETHEGMHGDKLYFQGCHICPNFESQYPLMTALGEPLYIVTASPSAACNKRLAEINSDILSLLPHGTGYDLPSMGTIENVELLDNGQLLFSLTSEVGVDSIFSNFSHTPYSHRGPEIVDSWCTDGELEIVSKLKPLLCSKL